MGEFSIDKYNHPFSQMVFCGNCGEVFRRVHWNNRGKKSIVWRCVSRLENTGLFCDASTLPEEVLKQKSVEANNILIEGKVGFITTLKKNIETALSEAFDQSTEGIEKRLEDLQNQLLQLASTKTAYDDVVNEIYQLRDLKQEALNRNAARQAKRQRSAELAAFLEEQCGEPLEFDEKLNKRIIHKITAYDDRLVVEYKSGLEIEVDL